MSDPPLPFERPLGARPIGDGTTAFRVWAPRAERIVLRAGGRDHELADAGLGVREAVLPVAAGEDYVYVIDGYELPDPCSRWQPAGLRGPSRVARHRARSSGRDAGFEAPALADSVIYELHVGTFTEEGTFDAAIPHLRGLRELGDHHDRADAGRRVPGRARLGLRRRLPVGRARALRRPGRAAAARRRRARRGPRRAARRRLQPRRRLRRPGARGLRPLLHGQVRDVLGQGDQLRRRAAPTACASGCSRAPRAGSATSTSTACASTRSTRSSTAAPSTSCRRSPRACTGSRRARS